MSFPTPIPYPRLCLKTSPHPSPPPAGEGAKPTADRLARCTWLLPFPPLWEGRDGGWRWATIAVETPITERPPHRSVRAQFGRTAPTFNMQGAFSQVAIRLAPGASEGLVIDQLNRLPARFGGTNAHGRDLQMSHATLSSEIAQQQVMGTVLPGIFLAVSAFLLNVAMGRQIATQREQVAALKALGYDNTSIGLHYLKLVLLGVALGVKIGVGDEGESSKWHHGVTIKPPC